MERLSKDDLARIEQAEAPAREDVGRLVETVRYLRKLLADGLDGPGSITQEGLPAIAQRLGTDTAEKLVPIIEEIRATRAEA